MKSLDDVLSGLPASERKAVMARAEQLMGEELMLRDIRKAMKQTQTAVARKLSTNQAGVSKIESRADVFLSTLRRYVEAIGGQLVLQAQFPGRPPVRIAQFSDIEESRDGKDRV